MNPWGITSNVTEGQGLSGAGACCIALLSLLGDKVSLPGSQGYSSTLSSYYAYQQVQLLPRCIVTPTAAEDVSTVIRSLTSVAESLHHPDEKSACNFAIRSGGHLTVTGAANVAGGVTLDLRLLNNIEVSTDKATATIGTGATWGDVYAKLDPLGLNVAGGRVAGVGVGGLTTGGGISFLSPQHGWTCDTVSRYQVVLADGSIVEATARENEDLWWALRGGAGNFGVVTAFTMETLKLGRIWGGNVFYPVSTVDQHLKAFAEFNSPTTYDDHASLETSFGFTPGHGALIVNTIEYTKSEENPGVFKPLMDIPSFQSTMRLDSLTNISIEQAAMTSKNMRQLFATTTHHSTVPMLNSTYIHWNKSLSAVETIPGIVWSLSLEPLPPAIYARAAKNHHRNALGLEGRSGSLVVTLLSATWAEPADDERVERAARDLLASIEHDAKKLNAYDPFVYLNYAAHWQDPIASYGKENVQRLREVRRRVDPKGVFTHQVPGGFKIPGAKDE